MTPLTANITNLQTLADCISKQADRIAQIVNDSQPGQGWLSADQVPTDDTDCVVIVNGGARYFGSPVGGKWMSNVVWWHPLPKRP